MRLACASILLLAALSACDAAEPDETGARTATERDTSEMTLTEGNGTMTTHPNGLTVLPPKGYVAQQTENGFRMMDVLSRAARSIEITLEPSEGVELPAGSERDGVPFVETKAEGTVGSGGQEYDLLAIRDAGERSIVLRARDQAEYGGPDFGFAWAVLDGAKIAE